jgi:hypothetical protein
VVGAIVLIEEVRAVRRMPVLVGAAAVAMTAWVEHRRFRPWHERWGATPDEATATLPGDALVAEPSDQITRAITVDATPEAVWPWIVQIGADRGGFYSYDWLENLFGLGIHSADRIVPEWQHRAVGDLVAATSDGSAGWYVVEIRVPDAPTGDHPEWALVMQVADLASGRPTRRDDPPYWEFQWTFALRPVGDGTTRVLVRERVAFGRRVMRWAMAPVGPVSFVMTRRMLIGIRARAERGAGSAGAPYGPSHE